MSERVRFERGHPSMSPYTRRFIGKEGEVVSKTVFPKGEQWLVSFGFDRLWLRPRYLEAARTPNPESDR